MPHYERHLGHLRKKRFVLLEIGIGGEDAVDQGGASLKMWRDYFRRADIVGLDLFDKSFLDGPRLTTVVGSQSDPAALRDAVAACGVPTVVVDDGSHVTADTITTFQILFPQMPDGAIYVIEDVQTSYWPSYGGDPDVRALGTTMAFVKDLIDGLNHEEYASPSATPSMTDIWVKAVHCYHNLVVIEKGFNLEGTNRVGAESGGQSPAAG